MSNPIPLNTEVLLSPSSVLCSTNGSTVIFHAKKGRYYIFNDVASRMLTILTESKQVSLLSLCNTLISEFDVDEETCREEITSFINDLRRKDIIQLIKNG